MVAPNHPLAGIFAKIERADKHIAEFEKAKKPFLDTHPYTPVSDTDPDTGKITVRIGSVETPPVGLSIIIGDAIHNLRSALDQLACQLVVLAEPTNDCSDRRLQFLISDTAKEFKSALPKAKIKLAGQHVLQIISWLQPYKGGQREALWEVHNLSIRDKHRRIIVATAAIDYLEIRIAHRSITTNEVLREAEFVFPTQSGEPYILEEGSPILRVSPTDIFPDFEEKADVNIKLIGDIAFDEPGIIESKTVLDTLIGYRDVVEDTVKQFLPLFP